MPGSAKVLLVGLDAAEPSLIRQWAAEGRLPHLARLIESGHAANLRSCAAEFPDEVWPSTYSSVNAAVLGKYYYIQPRQGSNGLEMVGDEPKAEQFWVTASRHGKRCAVIDAPKTALGPALNGIQLARWGTHATRCEMATHPPELLPQILAKHGRYPLETSDNHGRSPAEYRKLRDQLIEGARKHGALFRDLISREPWDLFFCAFSETHAAGHQFWHMLDASHPRHDPRDRHGLNSALREIYAAVDAELGTLIDAAGPAADVIVFSGHGMKGQYHGRDFIPTLLEMWGFAGERDIDPDPSRETRRVLRRDALRMLKAAVPIQVQYAVKSLLPSALEDAIVCRVMGSGKLNPRARVNYVPNNDLNPAFRVNLKGRDPDGIVEPGREYEELIERLTRRLAELIDPATGQPAIGRITRLRDLYHGPKLEVLPDLTAMWAGEGWIGEVRSPGYGAVAGDHNDLRTGGHNSDGFLVMRGPDFPADFACGAPTNKDLAPTVLDLLGVPIPEFMEGRSLAHQAV